MAVVLKTMSFILKLLNLQVDAAEAARWESQQAAAWGMSTPSDDPYGGAEYLPAEPEPEPEPEPELPPQAEPDLIFVGKRKPPRRNRGGLGAAAAAAAAAEQASQRPAAGAAAGGVGEAVEACAICGRGGAMCCCRGGGSATEDWNLPSAPQTGAAPAAAATATGGGAAPAAKAKPSRKHQHHQTAPPPPPPPPDDDTAGLNTGGGSRPPAPSSPVAAQKDADMKAKLKVRQDERLQAERMSSMRAEQKEREVRAVDTKVERVVYVSTSNRCGSISVDQSVWIISMDHQCGSDRSTSNQFTSGDLSDRLLVLC